MDLLEIRLLTDDLVGTRQFYHDQLGMDIQFEDSNQLKLAAGLSTLIFTRSDIPAVYHFAFTIPSNRFEEAHSWTGSILPLLEMEAQNTIADFKKWNAKAFYFYDNNKNIVEFISRFDLKNDTSNSFDGASVCCVSEIGIVGDSAQSLSEKLISEYGLPYFIKQQPQPDFSAIGDDNGLFIVVSENRPWYPTQLKAGRYPTGIRFKHAGKIYDTNLHAK